MFPARMLPAFPRPLHRKRCLNIQHTFRLVYSSYRPVPQPYLRSQLYGYSSSLMKICTPMWTVRGARRRFQQSLVSLEIPDLWLRSEAVNSLTWSWQHALSTLADFWADWKTRVSAGTKRKRKKHYCLFFFMLKGGWSDARGCWL